MMAVVARFNAISETLSIAPGQHAPIFEKTKDGLALPHPWCMGFLSAMQLRLKAWQPLLDLSSPDHALMLPILLYCVDALGGPMLEPLAEGTEMHEYTASPTTTFRSSSPQFASSGCRSAPPRLAVNPEAT